MGQGDTTVDESGTATIDRSHGYDAVCAEFVSIRGKKNVGARMVQRWAQRLPPGAAVLDLGCGYGAPISEALITSGFDVYGVDASPRMVAAFRRRVPDATVSCAPVEDSPFFGRTFDGVVAWGVVFLLSPAVQARLFARVAGALKNGGHFLFTAPEEASQWSDALTGRRSTSLGHLAYRRLLQSVGLTLTGGDRDEGENHYFFSTKGPDLTTGTSHDETRTP